MMDWGQHIIFVGARHAVPLLLDAIDESFDTFESIFELVVTGGVTRSHETFAAQTKRVAGDDGYVFFFEQSGTEGFIVKASDANVRKGVEGTLGFKSGQTDLVEALARTGMSCAQAASSAPQIGSRAARRKTRVVFMGMESIKWPMAENTPLDRFAPRPLSGAVCRCLLLLPLPPPPPRSPTA